MTKKGSMQKAAIWLQCPSQPPTFSGDEMANLAHCGESVVSLRGNGIASIA